ncbi:MAG TPA: hypothetical protein VG276_08935 [Actinomycetes bacterium]|nr:hypothetical protein [Actinomycetes bacterium]
MRLLVRGSRTWTATDRLRSVIDQVAGHAEDFALIEGGAYFSLRGPYGDWFVGFRDTPVSEA